MPVDYGSTARALALPSDSPRSTSPTFLRPPWNPPRRSLTSNIRRPSFTNRRRISLYRDEAIHTAEKLWRRIFAIWGKLSIPQRVLVVTALVVINVLGILFLVFNERLFQWLAPLAIKWKNTTGGWTILWAFVFLTAFPPVVGYGLCGTIAGFVYGVGEGWLIYASATVAGSFCSFLISRTVLRKYVERIVAHDKRFAALTLTLKQDGLKLLCMIRLCPLPYSLSNGAMSTFPTVHPVMYALATALVTPKLFVHVFIGSRLGAIGKNGGEMSAGAKAVNWISIIIGGMVGAFTGWYIYRHTMARARQLEAEERAAVQQSGTVPPPEFSDDPDAIVAATTLASPTDDTPDYFDEEDEGFGGEDVETGRKRDNSQTYRDEFTDDEDPDDVFERGDEDEEEAIGLHRNKNESKR